MREAYAMAQAHVRNVLGGTANGWINLAARDEILRRIRQDEDEQREGGTIHTVLAEIEQLKQLNHDVVQDEIHWRNKAGDRLDKIEQLREHMVLNELKINEQTVEIEQLRAKVAEAEARIEYLNKMVDVGGVVANAKATERALAAEAEVMRLRAKLAETDRYWEECQTEHHKRNLEIQQLRVEVEQLRSEREAVLAEIDACPSAAHEAVVRDPVPSIS
jgi:chromosome segregation ATPase